MIDFKKFKRMANNETTEAFRMEAFKELDLEDTVESNELFQKAWRYGYDGGHEEVFEHLRDLVAIQRETSGNF